MYIEKTDCYLKAALIELCDFTAIQAEHLIHNDKDSAYELLTQLSDIAERIALLKSKF